MTHELNLLPADFIEKPKKRRAAGIWIGTVLCGFVIIGAVFSISKGKIVTVKRDILHLQQQQNALQPAKETLQRLNVKREQLHRIEGAYQEIINNQRVSQISGILGRVTPPRVRVSYLKINHPNGLFLKGKADSNADVVTFMRNLNQYESFSKAKLLYATREQDLDQAYILFEIRQD